MNEGKKDRRDPIRTVKPRNFVAKNASATTSGAGAHKDKKKAAKQGDTKHKKKEYAESLQAKLNIALAEEFDNPEYNDEAGMATGNLYTLARAVKGLHDTIGEDDNLPEWCQEKIAKAEQMLVGVWDYLQSQKDQGINPQVHEGAKVDRQAKHITASMMKKGKSKKDAEAIAWAHIKHPKKKKAEEGWTHDTLADQLFEHERTYEDKLANMLNKKLNK